MEFVEITEDKKTEYDGFILRNSPESFLQSFRWGEFQAAAGHSVYRFAAYEDGILVALASAVEHRLPLGFRYWYLPRGPVMSSDASEEKRIEILGFFMGHVVEEARKRKLIFLRMDPAQSKGGRDIFAASGLRLIPGSVQPKDTLVLSLAKSEEELLAEMKQKTRYNVRLAEKKGVTVVAEPYSEKNFEEFWRLIGETSARDGIVSHDKEYYRAMLKSLSGDDAGLRCRLYFARYEGRFIAANIVLLFGPYAVYLHGASSDSDRNLMAPYLLQWQQIRDAKAAGCRAYDFWGITVGDENPKWAGITRFKRGFGGGEISYTGVYDLPIRSALHSLYMRLR